MAISLIAHATPQHDRALLLGVEDVLNRQQSEVIFEKSFVGWRTSKNRQKKESESLRRDYSAKTCQNSDRDGFCSARMSRASADKMFCSTRMRERNEAEDP